MDDIIKVIDSLEYKIESLLKEKQDLHEKCKQLEEDLTLAHQQGTILKTEITNWEEQYQALKLAKSMLGSNENKTEAKLKINSLIREIDLCITQLSE